MQNDLLNSIDICGTINDRLPQSSFVPIYIDGKLAFRYDPYRGLIEIQRERKVTVVDLAIYTKWTEK